MNTTTTAEYCETSTPRPGMNQDEITRRQEETRCAMIQFSRAAKQAAIATKRRVSPKSRTYYQMGVSKQVKCAFKQLETTTTTTTTTTTMTKTDFELLKQAISNFRVRLIVHDSISADDLRELKNKIKEEEKAMTTAITQNITTQTSRRNVSEEEKNRCDDLQYWSAELTKEVSRIEPKIKYTNIGQGLFRYDFNKPTEPPGVPSQHAHIAPSFAHALRNILTPETSRRTFISLASLTNKIRYDVCAFLTDEHRHCDRMAVIKQIKEQKQTQNSKK
jgi:hypothetical protein